MPGRMPEDMPDRMPEDMPDKMPEDMSDRMPEDLPVTKRIDDMVGITRSKVIWFFFVAIPWCSFFDHFVLWKRILFCFASPKSRGSACESFSHACQWKLGRFGQATHAVQLLL